MRTQNDDTLLKEFKEMPKQYLSDSAKTKMLFEITAQKSRRTSRSRMTRRIGSIAAGISAMVIVAGAMYGIWNDMQHQSSTTTGSPPATHHMTGYDYKKLLGFQPVLPKEVPSGYTLKNIQTEIDTLDNVGGIDSFFAMYQNGNSFFGVSELKATGHATIPMPYSTQKVIINGIDGVSYNQDGYTLQFRQNGIIYRVAGEANADQDRLAVMSIASSLTVPAQMKPNQIIRRSFAKTK